MENQFVPYELAVKLKELGFDEKCFGFWQYSIGGEKNIYMDESYTNKDYRTDWGIKILCLAPLWQQAFDWFHDTFGLEGIIQTTHFGNETVGYTIIEHMVRDPYKAKEDHYKSHYDARYACLEKLIEITELK